MAPLRYAAKFGLKFCSLATLSAVSPANRSGRGQEQATRSEYVCRTVGLSHRKKDVPVMYLSTSREGNGFPTLGESPERL